MNWKISGQEEKLDELFAFFQSVEDEEIRAYLAKFLCIRASGFVEASFRNLVDAYMDGTSPKHIQRFVSIKLRNASNLKYEKLLAVLKILNHEWAWQFEKKINDRQKAALNSVVSNRNNIAHGENDAISYELMKAYYGSIKEVVYCLKSIIKKR